MKRARGAGGGAESVGAKRGSTKAAGTKAPGTKAPGTTAGGSTSTLKRGASAPRARVKGAPAEGHGATPLGGTREARAAARAGARATFERLRALHPDAHCELVHASPFELLVATVLSAQTTDVRVNLATPTLFARYPDAARLAVADVAEVAELLRERGLGMFNQKAKNIVGLAGKLVREHGGMVPRTLAELVALPGVGRKTANVVLGVAFGAPEGVVVDTHVQRLAQRLGWTDETEPGPIELELVAAFPRSDWDPLSHTLIFHGRRVCFAERPACASCGLHDVCPSAFHAERVGRKR